MSELINLLLNWKFWAVSISGGLIGGLIVIGLSLFFTKDSDVV